MSFYNTTNATNPDLAEYRQKAENQNDVIMHLFESGLNYTPSEVNRLALPNAPITSVRRAITNLTDDGRLFKTVHKRNGIYGRQEYVWQIKKSAPNQMELL